MTDVLETTKYVVENSNHVKINEEKLDEFCGTFTKENIKHWWKASPYDLSNLTDEEKLQFLLVFNSLSFSYWGEPKWTVEYKGEKQNTATGGMITAIRRALDEGKSILDAHYLANMSEKDLSDILRANVEIPLFEERLEIVRSIGKVLLEKFEGSFSNVVKASGNNAMKLLELITKNFLSFDDRVSYKGKDVYFYKRAQLLVADIYYVFDGKGYGDLKNVDQLTACADYKLPQALRKLGIFEYDEALRQKIDDGVEIPKGSEEEIEIRANTLWTVEKIKNKLKERIPNIISIHINDHLWLAGVAIPVGDQPYHKTRTMAY